MRDDANGAWRLNGLCNDIVTHTVRFVSLCRRPLYEILLAGARQWIKKSSYTPSSRPWFIAVHQQQSRSMALSLYRFLIQILEQGTQVWSHIPPGGASLHGQWRIEFINWLNEGLLINPAGGSIEREREKPDHATNLLDNFYDFQGALLYLTGFVSYY